MRDPFSRPTIRTGLFYREPLAAIEWIEKAFGFRRSMDVRGADGALVHAEMSFGDASIIVDGEWAAYVASPASCGGRNTQMIYVRIEDGIDNHCERARAAGARIIQEPEYQYYGDSIYRAEDPEGHVWTFSQAVGDIGRQEAERLGAVNISGWHRE